MNHQRIECVPTPQVQIGIGWCTVSAHSHALHLEVEGLLEYEPVLGQNKAKKVPYKLTVLPFGMVLLM